MIGVVAWQTMAGDLNPPVGPVSPTMCTLEDICTKIDALDSALCCESGPWQGKLIQANLDSVNPEVVVPGNGILHAVIVPAGNAIQFYSGVPTNPIADMAVASGDHKILIVNIRFENGLLARTWPGSNTIRTTLNYRTDPQ